VTKSLENVWVFDPNRGNFENWRNAELLNFAWFALGDFTKREKFRDSSAKPPHVAASVKFEMQLEMRDRIAKGEFIALGIRIPAKENCEPEQIPSIYFAYQGTKIDFDKDYVSGLDREFHEVSICQPPMPISNDTKPISPIVIKTKRGGGRPSNYPKAKIILEMLFRIEAYKGATESTLLQPFNNEFQKRFSRPDGKFAPVSDRALRNYISRYRKELAETGNN
jgi:hypothetical protein